MKKRLLKNIQSGMIGIMLITIVLPACQSDNKTKSGENTETQNEPQESSPVSATFELPSIDQFNTEIAFVPSIGEGTISAINLNNNTIKWTLKVSEGNDKRGPESAMGVAASADGKWVFTGDAANNEAVIVDAENQKVVKRIPLSHGIHAIDMCPHGHWVWVSGRLSDYPWLTAVTVIDVEKQEKETTMSPGLGGAAHYAWTPDAKEVWAASVSTNTVWVWDAMEKKVLDVIPVIYGDLAAESPEASLGLIGLNEIVITPDGQKAFAVGPEAGVVFAIDVKKRVPLNAVKVGERTHGVGVTRDGKEVWTANNTGTVTILDVNTLNVLDQIDLSQYTDELPYAHIAFSLDGRKAYVSIAKDVAVIDVATREVITIIPFGYGTHENSLEDFYVKASEIERKEVTTSSNPTNPEIENDDHTQISDRAGIMIKATYLDEQSGKLVFHISIDTHSGDLMEDDIAKQSVIRLNNKEITSGFSWESESESSHHRKGTLSVKIPETNYQSLELELKDIGVDSRTFKWHRES